MAERILKDFENKLEFYSLNNPGIPFLADGEKLQLSTLAKQKLVGKMGDIEEERFIDRPISNIVYHQIDGSWVNGSWVVDVFGFDQSIFDQLTQPHSTTVQLLPVDKELAQVSGSSQMVQIGFNVGGGELVFKRILLPSNYRIESDWQEKVISFSGTKMPDVFVAAWDNLKVDTVDQIWHDRVREQLLGNSRDMGKRIEYQMINGEKWIIWNGVKIWAGLLSDKRDIERFLAEEQALVNLKPGEFMVAKYTHGGGGAISAATSQERKVNKPMVVGDIQMMGENGAIYQAAMEGDADQIDALIGGLVTQLHHNHNLSMPEAVIPLRFWVASVPVLPMAMYPMKFLLEGQPTAGFEPAGTITENLLDQASQAVAATVFTGEITQSTSPIIDDGYQEAGDVDFEVNGDVADWWVSDVDPDWNNGGDDAGFDSGGDGSKWPEKPIPGGGLTRPITTSSAILKNNSLESRQEQLKPSEEIIRKQSIALPTLTEIPEVIQEPVQLKLESIVKIPLKESVVFSVDKPHAAADELSIPEGIVFAAADQPMPTRLDLEGQAVESTVRKTTGTLPESSPGNPSKKIEEVVIYQVPQIRSKIEIPTYQHNWEPVQEEDIPNYQIVYLSSDGDSLPVVVLLTNLRVGIEMAIQNIEHFFNFAQVAMAMLYLMLNKNTPRFFIGEAISLENQGRG